MRHCADICSLCNTGDAKFGNFSERAKLLLTKCFASCRGRANGVRIKRSVYAALAFPLSADARIKFKEERIKSKGKFAKFKRNFIKSKEKDDRKAVAFPFGKCRDMSIGGNSQNHL